MLSIYRHYVGHVIDQVSGAECACPVFRRLNRRRLNQSMMAMGKAVSQHYSPKEKQGELIGLKIGSIVDIALSFLHDCSATQGPLVLGRDETAMKQRSFE